MSKRFRECSLDQDYLLPPSLHDWLPENHLARFIAEVSEQLDLGQVHASYQTGDGRGLAAYHPLLMVRLLLYGYCVGRRSSRQIEKATHEDVAFRYLAGNQHPDHDTIAAFRRRHVEALGNLFAQVLELCRAAGLVKVGAIAIDGTKMKANASREQTVRYGQLEDREERLQQRVREILEEAERADAEEDARYGRGRKEPDLPPELATVEGRLQKIREAKQRLEQEAAERTRVAEQEREQAGGHHRNRASKKRYQRGQQDIRKADPQINFTDPDSKIMRDPGLGAYVQGYNAQAGVDAQAQVIVMAEVMAQAADRSHLIPMIEAVRRELRAEPEVVLADAGYFSSEALEDERLRGCEVLVSPDGHRARTASGNAVVSNFARQPAAVRMREKLATEQGRRLYALRQAVVEPVFGQIKEARGIRRFLLRGLRAVRAEWRLIALTHNLLRLFRHPAPHPA